MSQTSEHMSNHAELVGRVAVVTGATRQAGIGAAIARELVAGGAAVFITHFREYDRRQTWGMAPGEPESILATLGASAAGTEIDLSAPSAAVELFDRAISRFGHVDILVNNAAHWEHGGITDVSAAQLDRHYAVNLRAAVLLSAEFVRRRGPEAGGRIINITSGQGHGPMPGELAYAVTKAGLDALTLSLSAGLVESGVAVNAIDPGPTDTGWIPDDQRATLVAASAAGKIGTPQDVAAVVRLLAGDAAASVTGRIIRIQSHGVVDDLMTELANRRLHSSAAGAITRSRG
jgi:3-oxoacyl-[acyl-carrier protein] reductase